MVNLAGADANEAVLINRDDVYSQTGWHFFIDRLFRGGLILLDFEEHRYHRRHHAAGLHTGTAARYVDSMAPLIAGRVATWPPGDASSCIPR